MAWYKDYKQVLSLLMFIAGVLLVVLGNEAVGIPLLAAASGVTLGAGKVGAKKILPLLLVGVLLVPMSCKISTLSVDAVAPAMEKIMDRHDAYVKADATLDEFLKKVYLRTSELMRLLIKEAQSDS